VTTSFAALPELGHGLAQHPLMCPSRQPDEGPCGYALRLAEENRVSNWDILRVMGAAALGFSGEAEDVSGHALAVRQLSGLCRFCPRCLRARVAWHLAWETPCADACATCGAWLVDECGACFKPLTWKRPNLMSCLCGNALSLEEEREAPPAMGRLALALSAPGMAKAADLAPIAGMSRRQAAEVVWFLGRFAIGNAQVGTGGWRVLLPLRDSWSVTAAAAEIIVRWPLGFCRVLDQRRERSPEHDRGSLLRVFPQIYAALYRHLTLPLESVPHSRVTN